jgi:hypothetical protein
MPGHRVDILFDALYKNKAAVRLETDTLAATFLPEPGAKLASFFYKPLNREMLIQRPGPEYRDQPFDGEYVSGEASGMDDMFPTIDAWEYDRFPWEGIRMSDHGEVWSLPWDVEQKAGEVTFSVHGIRFPYRLSKTASFPFTGTLRLGYELKNLAGFDLECIWAAHIMLEVEAGARVLLPEEVDGVILAFDLHEELGTPGDTFPFPTIELPDGRMHDFTLMRPADQGGCYKYYLDRPLKDGECSVVYPRSGIRFTCRFPAEQVPYFGILPNEGVWDGLYNLFLEPCTAPMDRPDRAREYESSFILKAGDKVQWYLDLSIDPVEAG